MAVPFQCMTKFTTNKKIKKKIKKWKKKKDILGGKVYGNISCILPSSFHSILSNAFLFFYLLHSGLFSFFCNFGCVLIYAEDSVTVFLGIWKPFRGYYSQSTGE